jgi:hypothetical protein
MANTVDKVLKVAADEVGYLEKSKAAYLKDPSVLYKKTAGAGSDNYTKYGKEMHEIYPQVMDFPAYWCDCFVDWCFQKAYGVSNAKGLIGGNFDDYTPNSVNLYKKKNAYFKRGEKTPQPGDQIFFQNEVRVCHTGIVVSVDSKYVYTIEGNTSNKAEVVQNGGCVARKQYLLTSTYINGYGRPKYDVVNTPVTESVQTPKKSIEEIAKEVIDGKYGSGEARKKNITALGYNYAEVQAKVIELCKKPSTSKPVTSNVKYFKKFTGSTGSIAAALKAIGVNNSFGYRKKIAAVNKITPYTGTAAQNTQMVNLLKQGKLIKP